MPAGAINIRSVPPDHYIVTGDRYEAFIKKKLASSGRQFLYGTCTQDRGGAVIATHRGEVVGFVLHDWCYGYHRDQRVLVSCGTWVHPQYRRHSIALRLWRRMLSTLRPHKFNCTTVSRSGAKFAQHAREKLAPHHPTMLWEISSY